MLFVSLDFGFFRGARIFGRRSNSRLLAALELLGERSRLALEHLRHVSDNKRERDREAELAKGRRGLRSWLVH